MVRKSLGMLGAAALSLGVVMGTATTANADTWVYHSTHPTQQKCEQAWSDLIKTPGQQPKVMAGQHECRVSADRRYWQLWYTV